MKIAIAGKGGVGKTTLSASLARSLCKQGERVVAIDADPNNCLGRALGVPEDVLAGLTPLSEMKEMLAERAGTNVGGSFFNIAPEVEDLLDKFGLEHDGITLLVMGTVDEPGAGCVCPESAVLKALVRHLVGLPDLSVIMDMEAGLEHLGRGTAQYIGALLIVSLPTSAAARTAARLARLARGLRLRIPGVVMNGVSSSAELERLRELLDGLEIVASLPRDESVSGSEVVPESGVYVEAVERLREELSKWGA